MGAWIEITMRKIRASRSLVAPLVGAWIEIYFGVEQVAITLPSLPSWERGLKLPVSHTWQIRLFVAPLVGAWIEIIHKLWIKDRNMSLPSWERGLKFS